MQQENRFNTLKVVDFFGKVNLLSNIKGISLMKYIVIGFLVFVSACASTTDSSYSGGNGAETPNQTQKK